ncbi:sensor histidine kinase efflux regulator BaeS, partial [Acinetobacter variabilis]
YGVYNDLGNVIQAQILQIEGEAAPDDYVCLSRWWLRGHYDIALQQRYFQDHTLANVAPSLMGTDAEQRTVNEEELR